MIHICLVIHRTATSCLLLFEIFKSEMEGLNRGPTASGCSTRLTPSQSYKVTKLNRGKMERFNMEHYFVPVREDREDDGETQRIENEYDSDEQMIENEDDNNVQMTEYSDDDNAYLYEDIYEKRSNVVYPMINMKAFEDMPGDDMSDVTKEAERQKDQLQGKSLAEHYWGASSDDEESHQTEHSAGASVEEESISETENISSSEGEWEEMPSQPVHFGTSEDKRNPILDVTKYYKAPEVEIVHQDEPVGGPEGEGNEILHHFVTFKRKKVKIMQQGENFGATEDQEKQVMIQAEHSRAPEDGGKDILYHFAAPEYEDEIMQQVENLSGTEDQGKQIMIQAEHSRALEDGGKDILYHFAAPENEKDKIMQKGENLRATEDQGNQMIHEMMQHVENLRAIEDQGNQIIHEAEHSGSPDGKEMDLLHQNDVSLDSVIPNDPCLLTSHVPELPTTSLVTELPTTSLVPERPPTPEPPTLADFLASEETRLALENLPPEYKEVSTFLHERIGYGLDNANMLSYEPVIVKHVYDGVKECMRGVIKMMSNEVKILKKARNLPIKDDWTVKTPEEVARDQDDSPINITLEFFLQMMKMRCPIGNGNVYDKFVQLIEKKIEEKKLKRR